jgi:hypothetical protein
VIEAQRNRYWSDIAEHSAQNRGGRVKNYESLNETVRTLLIKFMLPERSFWNNK